MPRALVGAAKFRHREFREPRYFFVDFTVSESSDNGCPSRVYAFELLGMPSFAAALLCRVLGREVYFLRRAPVLQKKFWNGLLAAFDIRAIDLQKCKQLDGGSLGTDHLRHGSAILEEMRLRSSAEKLGAGLFPDIGDVQAKLGALLLQRIQTDIAQVQMLAAWVGDYSQQHPQAEVCVIARRSLPRCILLDKLRINSILVPAWIGFAKALVAGVFSGIVRRFNRKIIAKPSPVAEMRSGDAADYSVIFFPHRGAAYGSLYEKNQFYADAESSPFHPSNILHVDIHGGDPGSGVNRVQLQPDGSPEITLPGLTQSRALSKTLRTLPFYLGYFWGRRDVLLAKSVGCNVAVIIYLCIEHLRFLHYLECCRQFKSAKIALVGFEILFPKPLALALESLQIKTVASQERFLTSFMEGTGFILDTYFVPTAHVGEYVRERENVVLRQYIPVGQVRSDTLHHFEQRTTAESKHSPEARRPMVLALDFHSVADVEKNRLLPLNNYLANRQFYMQIAGLALEFPGTDFVIRGKNNDWLEIGEFEQIAQFLDMLPNVSISRDYSRFNIQYELVARADAIVARAGSLCDEALGAGKPVIFVDYFPHSISHIDKIFNYDELPVIANDYAVLKSLLYIALETPQAFDTLEFRNFRDKYYGPYDGKVRERIAAVLDELYNSCHS